MKTSNDDFSIVRNQFISMTSLERTIVAINTVSPIRINSSSIGQDTDHISAKNYKSYFDEYLKKGTYALSMIDDSMIFMSYTFNEEKRIIGHTLSFLPTYKSELFEDTMLQPIPNSDDLFDIEDTDVDAFNARINQYIRIDLNPKGREKYYHTLSHMHIGFGNKKLRLPLQCVFYPNEFLYLIFKYVYHFEDGILSSLECNIPKACLMDDDEMKKLRMAFGNCY